MNGIELIEHLAAEADIELPYTPYIINDDDWVGVSIPYKESNHYWHVHIPMEDYNADWRHYIDINLNRDTLSLNILHSFYDEAKEEYRFFRGALLYYDSFFNEGSVDRTIDQLKEIKRILVPGYFPIEYPESIMHSTEAVPKEWGWEK